MIEHLSTLDQHPLIMDYEDADYGHVIAINMPDATQIPLVENYDSKHIVAEPDDIVDIASTCSRNPIKKVTADEQHLWCSKTEALDAVMWKSRMKALKIPSKEEAMEATIQRKQAQGLNIYNEVLCWFICVSSL